VDIESFEKMKLTRKENFERISILRFIACSRWSFDVEDIRFGNANIDEPDFIITTTGLTPKATIRSDRNRPIGPENCKKRIMGVEVTDAFKDAEQAKSKRQPNYIPNGADLSSTRSDLVKRLDERVIDKIQNKTYDRSELDELILLVVNETNRATALTPDSPFQVFDDGTPSWELTALQQVGRGKKPKNKAKFDEIIVLTPKASGGDLILHVSLTWPGNSFFNSSSPMQAAPLNINANFVSFTPNSKNF
jgi:hypothetical protein